MKRSMNENRKAGLAVLLGATFLAMYTGSAQALIHNADPNTIFLYHLEETSPDGFGSADFEDSGPNGLDAYGVDIDSDQLILGVPGLAPLGNAVQMVGATNSPGQRNSIVQTVTPTIWSGGSFTFEAWIRDPGALSTANATSGRWLMAHRDSAIAWSLGMTDTGALRLFGNNNGSVAHSTPALTWDPGVWYYVALVSDTTGQAPGEALYSFYRATSGATNLTLIDSLVTNAAVNTTSSESIFIGGPTTSDDDRTFQGYMDEIHYSSVARSEQYLLAHVPEPTHAILALIGGAILAGLRKKKTS